MKKDKEWLKDEIKVFQKGENMFTAEFNAGVQQALEYVQELIDQLDEPETLSQQWIDEHKYFAEKKIGEDAVVKARDLRSLLLPKQDKPVIPQFVADWIEKQMKFGYEDVFISMTRLRERAPEKVKFWFRNNSDTYARAWLDGYEVEKIRKRHKIHVDRTRNQRLRRTLSGFCTGGNGMNLKIKRLTQTAKLPDHAFPTEAGFDIFTDEEILIESNQTVAISTGIALEIPDGYYGRLKGRSGLTLKSPLRVLEGTIDSSYRGEVKVMADVKKDCTYHVPKGAKIAQLIIQPLPYFEVVEVDELSQSDRGTNGFGSTGV